MANFKMRLGISGILAAMLLSGCQSENEDLLNESSRTSSTQLKESSSVPDESSRVFSTQPEESSTEPVESSYVSSTESEESYDPSLWEDPFNAGRVYPDDNLFPKEWLRISTCAEIEMKINEVVKSDTSGKDLESALAVLMDRNILLRMLILDSGFRSQIFKTDWDVPYSSPDFENPIYPTESEYFTDAQSIYNLFYNTYERSVAEKYFCGYNGEPCFADENGQMYININVFPGGAGGPPAFYARSYVEIIEKTDNKCTFIWHYPDMDSYTITGYNQPESGYEFFYFEKTYTAEYIDGSWKLNKMIHHL